MTGRGEALRGPRGKVAGHALRHEVETTALQVAGGRRQIVFEGARAYTDNRRIVLPQLSPIAWYDEEQAGILIGYATHEGGHCRYSDWADHARHAARASRTPLRGCKPGQVSALYDRISNYVDDRFVEWRTPVDYPGTRRHLDVLRAFMARTGAERVAERIAAGMDHWSAAVVALACVSEMSNDWSSREVSRSTLELVRPLAPEAVEMIEGWEDGLRGLTSASDVHGYAFERMLDLVACCAREEEAEASRPTQAEPKPEPQNQPKPEPQPEPTPQPEPEATPEPEPEPELQPEPEPEERQAEKPETEPQPSEPEPEPEPDQETSPEPESDGDAEPGDEGGSTEGGGTEGRDDDGDGGSTPGEGSDAADDAEGDGDPQGGKGATDGNEEPNNGKEEAEGGAQGGSGQDDGKEGANAAGGASDEGAGDGKHDATPGSGPDAGTDGPKETGNGAERGTDAGGPRGGADGDPGADPWAVQDAADEAAASCRIDASGRMSTAAVTEAEKVGPEDGDAGPAPDAAPRPEPSEGAMASALDALLEAARLTTADAAEAVEPVAESIAEATAEAEEAAFGGTYDGTPQIDVGAVLCLRVRECVPGEQRYREALGEGKALLPEDRAPLDSSDEGEGRIGRDLRRVLVAVSAGTTRRRCLEGRLDQGDAAGLALGAPDVFWQRREAPRVDTALQVLVDQSRSTAGIIGRLGRIAYRVAQSALTAPGLKVGVATYTGTSGRAHARDRAWSTLVTEVRGFDEPHGTGRTSFEAWNRGPRIMHGTPTAEAVVEGLRRLASRREARRILLVLTDGRPDDLAATVAALRMAEASGVEAAVLELVARGRKASIPCGRSAAVASVEEVPAALSALLAPMLLGQGRMSAAVV